MQACYDQVGIMVSSIIKPTKNSCEHSSEMPTRVHSPSTSLTKITVNSKLAHGINGNGQVTPSPPSSPQRVTRSHTSRFQTRKEDMASISNLTTKTKGGHSNDESSFTHQSNAQRLVCPELAISYASTIIHSRVGALSTKQSSLDLRLIELNRKLRKGQLKLVQSHAKRQLDFHKQSKEARSRINLTPTTFEAVTSQAECGQSDGVTCNSLPIQVDGASDDSFLSLGVKNESSYTGCESFSSVESSVQDEESVWVQVGQRLDFTRCIVDDEVTDCSSDEESEDMEYNITNPRLDELKRNWEQTRALVGSKWAWLERRISELNKQICRLDYKIQRRPSRKNSTFSTLNVTPTSYVTLSNGGSLLDHLHLPGSLTRVDKGARKPGNGIMNHNPIPTSQYLPQLFLPGGVSTTKLQVKDLLAPSPLGQNFSLIVDESGDGCSRTRPLEKLAARNIIRKPPLQRKQTRRGGVANIDSSYHPHLSLPHEIPSRLLLDGHLNQIFEEHSYSQLLPLSKRRKAASSLAHLSTARPSLPRLDSATPSPVSTPLSSSSSIGKVSRRRVSQMTHQPSPLDTSDPFSPPVLSRPDTPSLTPVLSLRRKRVMMSTPSYDIDNIVIPYSVASSARLEKLEYKEIITPSWREIMDDDNDNSITQSEVNPVRVSPPPTSLHPTEEGSEEGDEDISHQAYISRHDKCELQEKKRFLNFISGGQRKRSRPQNLASTPDSISVSSPISLSASKRGVFRSPTPSESDLCSGQYVGVLPWLSRDFPLIDKDLDALYNPPPPPAIVRGPLSPNMTFDSQQLKSRTPSIASTLATPLSSPISTPNEETPLISPTEWVVVRTQCSDNSNSIPASKSLESGYKPSSDSHIVLKLSKRA